MDTKEIAIIIAAYNEEKNIKQVIKDLYENNYRNIIVVNDGSTDNTNKIAEKEGVMVLNHIINRGQGAALQTGITYALKTGAKYIITFDADGQHQAKEISKLLKPIENGEVDLTLGSRFLENSGKIPLGRAILLKGSRIVDWFFSGVKLTDSHNGFRALSRKAAEKIHIDEDRMAHSSVFIQKMKENNLKYKEVPVNIKYTKETLEKGHGSFLQAVNVLFRLIIRKLM